MFVSALSDPTVGSIGIGLPGDLYILGKLLACEIFLPGLSHCCKIFQTRLSSVWNKPSLEAGGFIQWNTLLANKTGKWHTLMDGGGVGVGVGAEWGVLYCWSELKLAENMDEASWLSPHEMFSSMNIETPWEDLGRVHGLSILKCLELSDFSHSRGRRSTSVMFSAF